jgi:uncharacterized membrane protein
MSTGRLETFADGVFAIAATLLILDVGVPGGRHLAHQLVHAWPEYAAYVVSFMTIGIIWSNHHLILRVVDHADSVFLYLNVLLLLFVAFLPFPTRVLAEALQSGEGANAAAASYGICALLMGASFLAIWLWASRGRRLLRRDAPERVVAGITRSFVPGTPLYATAIVLSLFSAWAGAAMYAAIAAFYIATAMVYGRN